MCECDLNRISSFHLAFVLIFDLISITSDMQINRKLKIIANFSIEGEIPIKSSKFFGSNIRHFEMCVRIEAKWNI